MFTLATCVQEAGPHAHDSGTAQRKKRSTRGRATPDQDTESLPDQATDSGSDLNQKKKGGKTSVLPGQATEAAAEEATGHEQQKKNGRSTRVRAVPDQVMEDAVISDTDEEEQAASDEDFIAVSKGSKKVKRLCGICPIRSSIQVINPSNFIFRYQRDSPERLFWRAQNGPACM